MNCFRVGTLVRPRPGREVELVVLRDDRSPLGYRPLHWCWSGNELRPPHAQVMVVGDDMVVVQAFGRRSRILAGHGALQDLEEVDPS